MCAGEVWTEGSFTHAIFQGCGGGSEVLLKQVQLGSEVLLEQVQLGSEVLLEQVQLGSEVLLEQVQLNFSFQTSS